jgi:hypothetical protein
MSPVWQRSQAIMDPRLFAMLILVSWTQQEGGDRPRPRPRADVHVFHVRVMVGGERQARQLTLAMPAPSAPADEDDDRQPAQPIQHFNIGTAVVEPENFDRWLFADERSEEERWRHLDEILRARIEAAALGRKLTDPQRAKLRIAGKGDIKRFFDQVEEKRSAFETDRRNVNAGLAALQRLDPLSQFYRRGPFGDGSLFAKTLQKIDDDRKAGH